MSDSSSINDILAQAQTAQSQMAAQNFVGSSDNNKVVIEVNGDFSVKKVTIDRSVINPQGQAELEKMVGEAVAKAFEQAVVNMSSHLQMAAMNALMGSGIDISGLLQGFGKPQSVK